MKILLLLLSICLAGCCPDQSSKPSERFKTISQGSLDNGRFRSYYSVIEYPDGTQFVFIVGSSGCALALLKNPLTNNKQ